jgi:hypothetical protein
MPSHSKKQHDFMEAIAHNKAFAKKVGVPQKVGQDFSNADKGKHFSKGGDMKHEKKMAMGGMSPRAAALMGAMAPKRRTMAAPMAPAMAPGMKHGGKAAHHEDHHHHMKMAHHHLKMAMKAGGKTMEKGEPHSKDMGEKMLKHGGKTTKHHYAKGGDVRMEPSKMEKSGDLRKGNLKHGEHVIQERGHTRALQETMKGNTIGNGPIVNAKKRGGRIC